MSSDEIVYFTEDEEEDFLRFEYEITLSSDDALILVDWSEYESTMPQVRR